MGTINGVEKKLEEYRHLKEIIFHRYQVWNDVMKYKVRDVLKSLFPDYDAQSDDTVVSRHLNEVDATLNLIRLEIDYGDKPDDDKMHYNFLTFHCDSFRIAGDLIYTQILNGQILVSVQLRKFMESHELIELVETFEKRDTSKWVDVGPAQNLGEYDPEDLSEESIYDHIETLISNTSKLLNSQ